MQKILVFVFFAQLASAQRIYVTSVALPPAAGNTGAAQGVVGMGPQDGPNFQPCYYPEPSCSQYQFQLEVQQNLFVSGGATYYATYQFGNIGGTALTTFELEEQGVVVQRVKVNPVHFRHFEEYLVGCTCGFPNSYTGPARLVATTIVTTTHNRVITLKGEQSIQIQSQAAINTSPAPASVTEPQEHIRIVAAPSPTAAASPSAIQGLISSGPNPNNANTFIPCVTPHYECSRLPPYGVEVLQDLFPAQDSYVTHSTTFQTGNVGGTAVTTFTLKEGGEVVDEFTANPIQVSPNTTYLVSYNSTIPAGYTGPAHLVITTVITTTTNQTIDLIGRTNLQVLQSLSTPATKTAPSGNTAKMPQGTARQSPSK